MLLNVHRNVCSYIYAYGDRQQHHQKLYSTNVLLTMKNWWNVCDDTNITADTINIYIIQIHYMNWMTLFHTISILGLSDFRFFAPIGYIFCKKCFFLSISIHPFALWGLCLGQPKGRTSNLVLFSIHHSTFSFLYMGEKVENFCSGNRSPLLPPQQV